MTGDENPAWRRYLRFWGTDPEGDVSDELDFHFSMRVEDLKRGGLSDEEARTRAQREFGDVKRIRSEMTDIGERRMRRRERLRMAEALRLDAAYGIRSLLRNPGFAIVAILTLALGIGANTAIFSTVDAVLLRALPFRAPHELFVIWNHYESAGRVTLAPAEYAEIVADARGFDAFTALSYRELNMTGDGDPEHIAGLDVSPNFFEVLGVPFAIGRGFGAGTASRDASVAVITHDLWARRFGGNGSVIGRTVMLDGASYAIAGVLPESFDIPNPAGFMLPRRPEIFIPRDLQSASGVTRGDKFLRIIGRASPSIGAAGIDAGMSDVARRFRTRLPHEYPDGWRLEAVALHEQTVGAVRGALMLIMVVVGLVLMIACINVANLVLARSTGRRQEMAVRTSLGATRGRVVRQLIAENMVLAVLGGALGVLLSHVALQIVAALPVAGIPRLADVRLDARVLRVAALVTGVAGLLLGLSAAASASTRAAQQSLRAGGRGIVAGGGRGRAALVVAEIALACVVLAGTGAALTSLLAMSRVQPGFDASNRTVVDVNLPAARYATPASQAQAYDRVVESARAIPGVISAAIVNPLPLGGDVWNADFTVEGRGLPDAAQSASASIASITPSYFDALGIAVRDGRVFNSSDRADGAPVVIVDDVFAKATWPGESAIGKRIHVGGTPTGGWSHVVGVVDRVTAAGLTAEQKPQIYQPHTQRPRSSATLVLHTAAGSAVIAADVRRAFNAVDPELPVTAFRRMDAVVAAVLAPKRYLADLVAVFGVSALLLAAIGLYGLVAYGVTQRTRELGVRMAFGARGTDVVLMIVREGATLSLIGVGGGIVGVVALQQAVRGFVAGGSALSAAVLACVATLLCLTALLACYIPARRAGRMDPLRALRSEQ